jgi:Big-like domain-containing protein/NHL repeat-containing protein
VSAVRRTCLVVISLVALLVSLAPAAWTQQQHTITTVAGGGSPNDVPALQVGVSHPTGVFKDSAGNLYVSSGYLGSAVYKIDPSGQLTTAAGNGAEGYSGDGGPAAKATLQDPGGVCVDRFGNIFIADTYNDRIREIVAATGIIQTVAGNGAYGFSGDGGPATSAQLDGPNGVFVDSSGNIFIADTGNGRIREVVAATGTIQTVAGNGTYGFSGDGGPATNATFDSPMGVFVDGSTNIFIADFWNNRVREVDAATGIIHTIAGSGSFGFVEGAPVCDGYRGSGDGGPATSAPVCEPTSVFEDISGNIFIAESSYSRIREVVAATGNIQTVAAGLSIPYGVFVDSSRNVLIAATYGNQILELIAATGTIQAVAGNGTCCFGGDGGPAIGAQFNLRFGGLSVDRSGNIFIADAFNNRIRMVDADTGTIQTVAGSGFGSCLGCFGLTGGFSGDGGLATSAALNGPMGVFVGASGNIFVADSGNARIREVVATTGIVQTVAGNGAYGFSGDGGPATDAELDEPSGVFLDSSGNIIIADDGEARIREVVATTGSIQTVAGNGTRDFAGGGDGGPATSAGLVSPTGLAVDSSGNIFIADPGISRIREVVAATGMIQTVAGKGVSGGFSGDGGPATNAELGGPYGVFVDSAGNIFIADSFNNRVREVDAATGIIQTVAGGGDSLGDGGPATSAELDFPIGVAGDRQGNLFIAERGGEGGNLAEGRRRIRRVAGLVAVVGISVGPAAATVTPGATQRFTANVTNAINTAVTWSLSGTGCTGNGCGTISPQGLYTAPSATGSPLTVTVTATSVADNTKSATAMVTVPAKQASTVAVSSSANPSVFGQAVTLTATVHSSSGAGVPTGTITFQDGATTLGTSPLNSSGSATLTASSFAVAAHQITATYSGDSGFFASNGSLRENVSYAIRPLYDQTRSVPSGAIFPIKLYLSDVSGNDVSSTAVPLHATRITSVSGYSASTTSPGSANPGGSFRFEAALGPAGGYILNVNTTGLVPGAYTLQFTAGSDPLPHALNFAVR